MKPYTRHIKLSQMVQTTPQGGIGARFCPRGCPPWLPPPPCPLSPPVRPPWTKGQPSADQRGGPVPDDPASSVCFSVSSSSPRRLRRLRQGARRVHDQEVRSLSGLAQEQEVSPRFAVHPFLPQGLVVIGLGMGMRVSMGGEFWK